MVLFYFLLSLLRRHEITKTGQKNMLSFCFYRNHQSFPFVIIDDKQLTNIDLVNLRFLQNPVFPDFSSFLCTLSWNRSAGKLKHGLV
jgi:hypothetical protein